MRKMVKFASLYLAATLSMTTVLTAIPQDARTVMAEDNETDNRQGGAESFEGDAKTLHYAYDASTKKLVLTGSFSGEDFYYIDMDHECYKGGDLFELLDDYINFEETKIDEIFIDCSLDCNYISFITGTSDEAENSHINNLFEKITFGDNFINSTNKLKSLNSIFRSYSSTAGFKNIDISKWDTGNVTDMSSMFEGCSNLKNIDVSKLNTSNVTDMSSMFEDCSNLKNIDVSKFDTRKVCNLSSMFKGCSNLESVDISDFCVDSLESLGGIVANCTNLEILDLGFYVPEHIAYVYMYDWSYGLETDINLHIIKTPRLCELSGYTLNLSSQSTMTDYESFQIYEKETHKYVEKPVNPESFENIEIPLENKSLTYIIENTHRWLSKVNMATCTQGDVVWDKCDICNEKRNESQIEALGHIAGDPVIENRVEPTYDKEGGYDEVVYCTRDDNGCGHSEISRKHVVLEKLKKPDSTDAKKEDSKKYEPSKTVPKSSSTASKKTTYADGLNQINGEWVYCKNNKIDTSYTGLCKYNGSWWYVKNGKVDFSATTLCKYNGSWFYVSGGKVNFNYTGLCKYNGSWFYVNGGKVNFSYTGLCKYNGSWWYVKNGQVDFKTTGLCKYNGAWWYVKGGKVNFTTTLCKYNGTWWYIKNGKVDFSSTTLCKYGNAWYCVSGGKVAWNYTGLCKYGSAWYYVQKGVVNFKATTLTKYAGTWWYVKNGVLNTSTTLCKYGNSWFAVSGGKVAWGYSGTMKYNGGTYNVVNGIVKF